MSLRDTTTSWCSLPSRSSHQALVLGLVVLGVREAQRERLEALAANCAPSAAMSELSSPPER